MCHDWELAPRANFMECFSIWSRAQLDLIVVVVPYHHKALTLRILLYSSKASSTTPKAPYSMKLPAHKQNI